MKAVILAGGLGTRLAEETGTKPKPMVEIGERPVLWHIMNIFSAQGIKEFIVALGYKGDMIKDYFVNYRFQHHDLSISLKSGAIELHDRECEDWIVHLVDTGPRTETGGRIKRLARWIGDETFMLTYGDGVADIDIQGLLKFHKQHGKHATVTAVHPSSRFGELNFEGVQVLRFDEKPQSVEGWINGGFFVLEPQVIDYIEGDAIAWEGQPLQQLAEEGQLVAYRHEGFWQCMDTLRDVRLLDKLWATDQAPWKVWE